MIDTPDPIQFWGRVAPDRIALQTARRRWTYGELDAAVQESADMFLYQGLGSGEHVSLEFEPGHGESFVIALHALHRIGLLPVPIDARLTPEERQAIRRRALIDLSLTSDSLDPKPAKGRRRGPKAPLVMGSGEPADRRLDLPALLGFTSGTSGEPRGALLTHGNFFWSAIASARNLGVRAGDLWLCALPLHHVGGLSILTRSSYYGTGVLLHDRFDPAAVNAAIDTEGVTLVSLVPPMLERLIRDRGGRLFPTSLRAALVGGGPVPTDLLEEAAELRLRALPTYGLTEATSQVTTLSPREWPAGLATAGRPLPFVHVELRDESGRAVHMGEVGEIVVRGPTVMAAYFEDRDANASAWFGKWLRTGDIGVWDPRGRLVVLDRRADRIVTGGENVSPAEVERALRRHPAVLDACVVGVPSEAWGQEVAAAVTTRDGRRVSLEELRADLRRVLAPFKLPQRLTVMRELPRGESGKLGRRAVRELLEQMAREEPA